MRLAPLREDVPPDFPRVVLRNLVFLVIVLMLALRRLGPPY
jgi:hypothetical protein